MSAMIASAGAAAAASCFAYAVGVANNGGTAGVYGFDRLNGTNPGTISPVNTLNGVLINRIRSAATSEDLMVQVASVVAQTFFRRVVIQDTLGNWTPLNSSAATFTSGAGVSTWRWGVSGSFPYWTSTTPSPRFVLFFL